MPGIAATLMDSFFNWQQQELREQELREFESLVKQKEGTLDVSNDDTLDRQKQAISDSVKEFFRTMH